MKAVLRTLRRILLLTAVTVYVAQAAGCNRKEIIVSVSPSEFAHEINISNVRLVDVRTPGEYEEGHIAGAININVQDNDFQQTVKRGLPEGCTILVYCRSGRRSLEAAEILTSMGYRVVNLEGGILEWKEDGFPVTANQEPCFPSSI